MNRFTVRVELYDADEDDYTILHQEMTNKGFSRTIIGSDGIVYHLPPAEYNLIGDYEPESVRKAAASAAAKTGKSAGVLVTPSTERFWQNLIPVKS